MITKGANMNFLEISGEKYGSDELTAIVAARLAEIGVNSFQSIQVNAQRNHLSIAFDDKQDIEIAKAISGSESHSLNNVFETRNAVSFLLFLVNTSHQPGIC
jgi:hypothetical protein